MLAAGAQAQYNNVVDFYQANPDMNTSQYAGRSVNPAYWLVDWNRFSEMDSRLTSNGYVRLGQSSWEVDNTYGGGVPQRELALSYARVIGASVVIYSTCPVTDRYNGSAHCVAFYTQEHTQQVTSARRPTSAQATAAINRAQDAWHEPRIKGSVGYDPQTDTYTWLGVTSGRPVTRSAAWFLDKFGAYL
jgi:hypothetical protein